MLEINILDARNPRYDNPAGTIVSIDVLFSHLDEWVMFTVTEDDVEEHSKQLFDDISSGVYGAIASFFDTPVEERNNPFLHDLNLCLHTVCGNSISEENSAYLDAPELADKNVFWKTIYTAVSDLTDRTGTISSWSGENLIGIPSPATTSKTVSQICSEKVSEIVSRATAANKDILIMWSGGIDSTTALAAFKETGIDVYVTVNAANRNEYPDLYNKIVNGEIANFKPLYSEQFFAKEVYDRFFVVDGELGDQICGTHNVFEDTTDVSVIRNGMSDPYTSTIKAEFLTPEIQSIVDAAPIDIVDTADFFWWLNFIFKYSFVDKRIPAAIESVNSYDFSNSEHFFGGDDWQRWAMSNRTALKQFIVDNDRFKNKQPLKDYIFTVFQDEQYRDYMTKKGSLDSDMASTFKVKPTGVLITPDDLS